MEYVDPRGKECIIEGLGREDIGVAGGECITGMRRNECLFW